MIGWVLDFVPYWLWYAAGGLVLFLTAPWWWPIARAFWAMLPAPAKAALIGLVAALAAYLAGRNKGASNERARQKERDVKAVYRRQKSDTAVDNLSPAAKDKEMEKWYRD